MEISPIFIYIIAPIFVLATGIIITQFLRKYNKIDMLEVSMGKLLTKIEVLITRLDSHLQSHSQSTENEIYRRGVCNQAFSDIQKEVEKLNNKLDKNIEILNKKIDSK